MVNFIHNCIVFFATYLPNALCKLVVYIALKITFLADVTMLYNLLNYIIMKSYAG